MLSKLLLLFCFCLVPETFTKDDIKLYETADVEVSEGDSVTLHCGLRAVNPEKYRMNWLKYKGPILQQQTAVRYDGEGCGSALSPVNNGACGCATLTLPNVTRNHAGRYVCQVTIDKPILNQHWGNGTMITVTERRSPTNGTTQKSIFFFINLWLSLYSKQKLFLV